MVLYLAVALSIHISLYVYLSSLSHMVMLEEGVRDAMNKDHDWKWKGREP